MIVSIYCVCVCVFVNLYFLHYIFFYKDQIITKINNKFIYVVNIAHASTRANRNLVITTYISIKHD